MKWHKYPEEKYLLNEGQSYKIVYNDYHKRLQAIDSYAGDEWSSFNCVTHFAVLDDMPEDDGIDEDFNELNKSFEIWQKFPLNPHNDPLIIAIYRFLEKKFKVKK